MVKFRSGQTQVIAPSQDAARPPEPGERDGISGAGGRAKGVRRRRWAFLLGSKNRRKRGAEQAIPREKGRGLLVLKKIGAALGLALAMVAIAFGFHRARLWLLRSPHFSVREIRVPRLLHLSEAALHARAGISPGDNLFLVDLGAVRRRVEADPWVARAEVRRELPSVIVLEVTEREPAAVVALGPLYLADARGEAFKRASPDEAASLPVVTGVTRDGYVQDREASQTLLREGLLALSLWRARLRPAVGEAHVDPAAGVTLYTVRDAVGIRLGRGSAELLSARIGRVDAVREALARSGQKALRILADDSGDRVTVRLAEP